MAERIYSQRLGMISDTQFQAALGENLAQLQEVTWPIAGRYNAALDKVEVTIQEGLTPQHLRCPE